jgi:ribosomal protein L19
MSAIHHSIVTLRLYGDDLVPEEITRLLGARPTNACMKGEGKQRVGIKVGDERIAKTGMWRLCASDREPEDIDGQIREIFSQISGDVAVWQDLTKKYRVNLFCGLFMTQTNDGLSISPESMAILAERGIELWFDLYAPDKNGDETNT